MTVSTNAAKPLGVGLFGAHAHDFLISEDPVGQPSGRVTDARTLVTCIFELNRAALVGTREYLAEAPIILSEDATHRFHAITASDRVEFPEPPLPLDAF